jgi:O-antigen/teichoic acid export membrane protein
MMLRNSMYLFLSKMIGYGLRLVLPVVLVRVLSVGDFGTYRQFFLLELMILSIFQLGANQALFFFIPKDTENAGSYFLNSLVLNIVFFTVAMIMVKIFLTPLSELLKMQVLARYIIILSIDTLLIMLLSSADCYLLARERVKVSATFEVLGNAIISLATVTAALLGGGLSMIFQVLVAGKSVQLIATMLYIHFGLRGFHADRYFFDLRVQLKYGAILGMGGSISVMLMRLHSLVVSSHYGREVFAVYSAGCTDIPVVQIFAQSLATVALAKFTVLAKNDDWDGIRALWREILTSMYGFTIPAVLFFVLIAKPLVLLMFTQTYADAVDIFMINTLVKINFIWNASLVIRAVDRNDVTLILNIVTLVISLPVLYFASRWAGIQGVIIGHCVLRITWRLVQVRLANKVTGAGLSYFISPRLILAFYRDSWRKGAGFLKGMMSAPS